MPGGAWSGVKSNEEGNGTSEMRGRQYQKSCIKKKSGGEDWMELDWTRQLKSS